jgi:hypothetical protein
MKLYLDGVLVGSNSYTGGLTANKQPIVIGGSNATNTSSTLSTLRITDPFDGNIDEVAFYGTALSAEQIAQTRQRSAMGVVRPEDLGTIDGTDTLTGIEQVAFSDGMVVNVPAGSGSVQIAAATSSDGSAAALSGWISTTDYGNGNWSELARGLADNMQDKIDALFDHWVDDGSDVLRLLGARFALFSVDGVTPGNDGGTGERHAAAVANSGDSGDWVLARESSRTHASENAKVKDHKASDGSREAPAKNQMIDWNDSFKGLASPVLACGKSGTGRGGGQSNLSDFGFLKKPSKNHR